MTMESKINQKHTSTRILLCFLLLTVATKSSSAFKRYPHSLCVQKHANPSSQGWDLSLPVILRGGSDQPESKKKQEDGSDSSSSEEEVWEDAREQEDDEDDDSAGEELTIVEDSSEEEDDDDDEASFIPESSVDEYDPEDEDETVAEGDEEEESISLSQVLLDEAANGDNNNVFDEDDFADALQDGVDIDMVASSTIHTDDDSSSANVDRMDLADAYDEELLAEEDDEPLSPVLATGDEEDSQPASNDNSASISPGGGDEEAENPPDNSVEAVADDTTAVITDEMTAELKALKWKINEIRRMRPDMAAVAINKNLRRPREGMPANFCKDGKQGAAGKWRKAILPICVGALAVYAGNEVDWNDLVDGILSSAPTPTNEAPPVVHEATSPPPIEEATEETVDAAVVGDEEDESEPQLNEEPTNDEHHPHSLKPYKKPDDVALDQSWLDVVITKIENIFKGILTKEL